MLTYAFQVLSNAGYRNVATEKFENTGDLFAEILIIGIESQIKRYLNRDYTTSQDSFSSIRGKVDFNESIKSKSFIKKKLICSFDEFSINSYMNKILKSTLFLLLKADISYERKIRIDKLIMYFHNVDTINLHHINWRFNFNNNNQTYRMLMGICYLTINGLLQTQSDGTVRLMDFLDKQRMSHLYEKFILEYYKKWYPELHPSANQISWQVDNGNKYLLPNMKSDITLRKDNKIFIIDAKYYTHNLQQQYEKESIISSHLYQIFTYVKNKQEEIKKTQSGLVSGLLLYAKTKDEIQPDAEYILSGNKISVRNLDLSLEFSFIENQLREIISQNL